jgi:hypothetical protein
MKGVTSVTVCLNPDRINRIHQGARNVSQGHTLGQAVKLRPDRVGQAAFQPGKPAC